MPQKIRQNIVYLVFAANSCYTDVIMRKPAGVELIVRRGKVTKWVYKAQTRKIGQAIGCFDARYGVIGVYDSLDLDQLNFMVRDACEATKPRGSALADE